MQYECSVGHIIPANAETNVSDQVLTSTSLLVGYGPSGTRYERDVGAGEGISGRVRSTVGRGLKHVTNPMKKT